MYIDGRLERLCFVRSSLQSSAEAQHDRVVQQLHAELTGHGKNDNEVGGAKQRVGGSHGKQVGVAAQSGGQHYPIL